MKKVLLLIFVSLQALALSLSSVNAIEVGDIYTSASRAGENTGKSAMWGLNGYSQWDLAKDQTVGHVGIYLGMDEDGGKWSVDAGKEDFRHILHTTGKNGGIMYYKYSSEAKFMDESISFFV